MVRPTRDATNSILRYQKNSKINMKQNTKLSKGRTISCHRVDHRAAETSRAIGMEFAVMQEIYGRYLLSKLFPNSTRSQLKYIISRVGKLLLYLAEVLLGRQHALSNLKNYIWALKISIVDNYIHKFNEEISK